MNWKNPLWLKRILSEIDTSKASLSQDAESALKKKYDEPEVSIVIPVYNERKTILLCLHSVLENSFNGKYELIIVDNNSTDGTYELLTDLGLTVYKESRQGIGWARQKGLEMAKGEIVITADADCLYSPIWVDEMARPFKNKNVVCVNTAYNFFATGRGSRWKMQAYEVLREMMIVLRNKKHPYLNAWGGAMAFRRNEALKCGYDTRGLRGEDGRLCFDLMSYGKVHRISSFRGLVWTDKNTINPKGGESIGWRGKIRREVLRFVGYFRKPVPHDTKKSDNFGD